MNADRWLLAFIAVLAVVSLFLYAAAVVAIFGQVQGQ